MKILLAAITVCLLLSCEQNIDFNLETTLPSLVVEARIESGEAPIVTLSRSISFFNSIDPSVLENAFVRNADVFISNGMLRHKLKEYSYPIAPGITGYYYSIDSGMLSNAFIGEIGKVYELQISENNKSYEAFTSIPALALFPDSIWFMPLPAEPDSNKRQMTIRTTDPPGLGNYVRYFTRTNSEPFLPGPNSVFSDEIFDGTSYEVILPKGIDRNNPPDLNDNFFHRGDTVTLKYCSIDKTAYTFWNTWEFAFQSIGNPFSQPNKVVGNISNGGLGAFCGYACRYRTFILN